MNGLALCAGIGGLEIGLRLALGSHYRTVCYVERDAHAAATLVARMEDEAMDWAPVWDDIQTFDGEPWRGLVDIVSAGFPCQPFSAAGRKLGVEDDRWLWPHIAEVIAESEPGLVFLENVPGLVQHGLRVVWTDLRRLGFRVDAGFFSAAGVGAPHRRQRLFILAHSNSGGLEILRRSRVLDGERETLRDDADRRGGQLGEGDVPDAERGRLRVFAERGLGPARAPEPRDYEFVELGPKRQVCNPDREQRQGGCATETGRPTWPPPPGHNGPWHGLEPAVRRVAHGTADRVERLRAIGNGVVPLVAAHALRTLAARLLK